MPDLFYKGSGFLFFINIKRLKWFEREYLT